MIDDRRKRPWKKLRVVVEVSVPPTSRMSEADLQRAVMKELPPSLPILCGRHTRVPSVRVKVFGTFWPAFLRKEKGHPINFKKKPPVADEYKGL